MTLLGFLVVVALALFTATDVSAGNYGAATFEAFMTLYAIAVCHKRMD